MLIAHLTMFLYFYNTWLRQDWGQPNSQYSSCLCVNWGAFGLQQRPSCLEVFSGDETLYFKYILSLGQPDLEIMLILGQLDLPLERNLGISTDRQTYCLMKHKQLKDIMGAFPFTEP